MNNRKNLVSAVLYQFMHIAYGLVVPRLILGSFGSDVNGLVSSVTQFLSFISLLEGGLGAVVLAELYSPIEEKDHSRIKGILYSCQKFFSKLAVFFVIYTIILAIAYSVSMKEQYDFKFISSLILILSLTTLARYLFSITYKLYLQADQKIYIVNYLTTATLVVNVIVAFVVIKVFPEIRVLKLASSVAFFIQPLIYRHFIPKEYIDYKRNKDTGVVLKNRWSGFAQNLAHYVNMNTDIVLITIFCSLTDVSIYSVYLLGINALRSIITYVTNSYQSALGKYIAQKRQDQLENKFKTFCISTWGISLALYCSCLLVINPFVHVYTNNVNDANYYQPVFALLITLANLVYCLREPYRLLILAAGKFKETNFGSIMEAVLNIGISIALIWKLGLIGVAIGTLIAISYRMIYFIWFLRKDMLSIRFSEYSRYIITGGLIVAGNIALYAFLNISLNSLVEFFICSAIVLAAEVIVICAIFFGPKKSMHMAKRIIGRRH
jgi:O-antigen/teichoic acid export membrane protein